jgi:integrase/recombinase XerD
MLSTITQVSENPISDFSGATGDDHVIELWIHDKAVTTKKIYQRHVKHFLGFLGKAIASVTLADVYSWADTLGNLKPSTIKSRLYTIKSLISFCHKIGYIPFNVSAVVKPPKVANTVHQKALKPVQVKALVDAAKTTRDALIIRLGYYSAMRVSELSSLTWGSLHDNILTFVGKGSKQASIKIPQWLVDELLTLKTADSTDDSPVFKSKKGGHLTRQQIGRIVKGAAVEAGESNKVSCHWLRHSHITNALNEGIDLKVVSLTARHASCAFTLDHYRSVNPDASSATALTYRV